MPVGVILAEVSHHKSNGDDVPVVWHIVPDKLLYELIYSAVAYFTNL